MSRPYAALVQPVLALPGNNDTGVSALTRCFFMKTLQGNAVARAAGRPGTPRLPRRLRREAVA